MLLSTSQWNMKSDWCFQTHPLKLLPVSPILFTLCHHLQMSQVTLEAYAQAGRATK